MTTHRSTSRPISHPGSPRHGCASWWRLWTNRLTERTSESWWRWTDDVKEVLTKPRFSIMFIYFSIPSLLLLVCSVQKTCCRTQWWKEPLLPLSLQKKTLSLRDLLSHIFISSLNKQTSLKEDRRWMGFSFPPPAVHLSSSNQRLSWRRRNGVVLESGVLSPAEAALVTTVMHYNLHDVLEFTSYSWKLFIVHKMSQISSFENISLTKGTFLKVWQQ